MKASLKTTMIAKKKPAEASESKEPEKPKWIDRGWYLVLEFELTSSGKFESAVEIAKKNPEFTELVDERGITWFRSIFFKKDFPKFQDLFEIVGAWKNTRLYLKGDPIKREDFETWYASYKQYWGHRKVLVEADHCGINKMTAFPDFLGCFERNIYLRWRDPLYSHYQYNSKIWYGFGKRQGNTFHIDKPAIRSFLKRLNKEYEACPCYGHNAIDHYVNKLPNEINPLVHKEWQFKEDFLKITANRAFFNYDIALSTVPEICPVNEKSYDKFMSKLFKE